MNQFFICNQHKVESTLKTLSKLKTSGDGCTHYYSDNNPTEEWVLIYYETEYFGKVISVLKKLPEPTIEQLIDIATSSTEINDILGASFELYERERKHKEDFRNSLLTRLLQFEIQNLSAFEKERIKIIIYESNLYDATNRRDIVGKYITEIKKDSEYYLEISKKAKSILLEIAK
jgi:hypothetical protein